VHPILEKSDLVEMSDSALLDLNIFLQ